MSAMEWLYLVIGIAVLALLVLGGVLVGLLPGRRGQRTLPPRETGGDVLAPPETGVTAEPGLEVPPGTVAPTLERPEQPASRLVRLRQRLAGSGTLGRGLLGLLSRDQLDED